MADIKTELKSARECIKQKEYKEALKHCKNVLKVDKENYNGLVFIGVCATELEQFEQAVFNIINNVLKVDKENYNGLVFIGVCATELEQFEQAKQAYKKAIDVNGDLILAWQGLCTCLEKAKNSAWNEELVEGYSKLLREHLNVNDKWIETCNKLVAVLKQEKKTVEAVVWLKESLSKYSESIEVVQVWKEIIAVLKAAIPPESPPSHDVLSQLLQAYQSLSRVSEDVECNVEQLAVSYSLFLLRYAKTGYPGALPLTVIHDIVEKLCDRYKNKSEILDTYCLIWIHVNVGMLDVTEKISECFDKLLEVKPNSFTSYLASGVLAMNKRSLSQAIDFFKKALLAKKGHPLALLMIVTCQYDLHRYDTALNIFPSCYQSLVYVHFNETRALLEKSLCMMEAEILLEGKFNEKKKEDAKELLKKLMGCCGCCIHVGLLQVKVHIKCDEIEQAIKLLADLEGTPIEDINLKSLLLQVKACVSIHEKKFYDAELRLDESLELKEDYKSYFLLGEVFRSLADGIESKNEREYYPRAYTAYLKAAKLDPFYAPTFVRLGQYQHDFIKDMNKSMKCLEKALSLDPTHEEAAQMLGDIYLKQNMQEKAIDLYDAFTTKAVAGDGVWAWVRGGLLHLNANPDKAVVCFQHAIRGDTSISHHWECLAEAYFSKGSYTSSMKAFKRALELDPASTFCKYRIAKIKQMLSMDSEAILEYEELLEAKPTYVPALLGLAETHLHLQREKLKATLDGRAVDHAQKAINSISLALPEQPTYTCLWKTAADSFAALYSVTDEKCRLTIPETLGKILCLEEEEVGKEKIIDIATKCYMMAIKFRQDAATLWNDLAVCTFRHGMVIKGQEGEKKILQSIEIVKKALSLDPEHHMLWNTLGVIAGSLGPSEKVCGHSINDIQNPGLSQHAFIKSLEINPLDARVWSNLGALYLQHDKIKAAHEAFKKAQAADPSLVQAWVGQAIIAENIGDEEAMDLFRHTTQLSFHGEGSIAYAQWVCRMLKTIRSRSPLISTKPTPDMSHLPSYAKSIVANASVALQKSVERYKGDPCAYNTLGVLLEHQALYKQAELAFSSARKLLNSQPDRDRQAEMLRMVLLNQARVLHELKRYEDAIEIYNIVNLESVVEYCGLALAYYGAGRLKESFSTYEKALSVSAGDGEKSALLSAMGMVQYVMKEAEAAKSYLLKGSQFDVKCEHGLMALSALGLLHGDGTLSTAALVELANHKMCNNPAIVEKKAMLMSAFYMLQGQNKAAQRTLAKAILRYPNNAYLWCQLSKYISENNPNEYKSAVHCSKAASLMGPSKMTAKTEAVVSLLFPDISLKREFIKSVQRFVHSHPEHVESWVLLSTALMADLTTKTSPDNSSVVHMTKLALTKVDDALSRLRNSASKSPSSDNKNLALYTTLYSWTMQSYVVANIYYGEVSAADMFCNQIIPSLSGDSKAQELFIFLKGLASMQENVMKGDVSGVENIRVMSALATKDAAAWKWKIMSQLYTAFSMLTSSELCLRHLMKLNVQKNVSNTCVLFSMCLLAIHAYHGSRDEVWLQRGVEIVGELMRIDESNPFSILLRAVLFFQEGKQKAALKYLQKLTMSEDALISDLQQSLLEEWK